MSQNKEHKNRSLGKLIGLYSTSPAAMQRAAILAFLSFVFFIAMLFFFYLRPQIGYFFLSSAFLIIHLITLTGMWMQKKNAVKVYSNGVSYRKTTLYWEDIVSAETSADNALHLTFLEKDAEKKLAIPRSINNLDNLTGFIQSRTGKAAQQ